MSGEPVRRLGIVAALALVAIVFVAARRYRPDDSPFTPRSDGEVLETIASGTGADPAADELRTLESALAKAPNDLRLACTVAQKHIEAARTTGDARRLSYAQAALAPWWDLPTPPIEALVMRATIKQSRHEFPAALVDLDAAVKVVPRYAQAWITRATVLTVLARYDEARTSCAKLRGLADPIVEVTCTAAIDGETGHGADARAHLTQILDKPGLAPAQQAWARSVRGEVALYDGDSTDAEADLRSALALDPSDAYSRALLGDLLLDAKRPADVLTLIPADETNEVLLLRRAIAGHRVGAADARTLAATLRGRVDELRLRGDTTHRREEARLVFSVEDHPVDALPIAVANFAQQEEPWDARVLLEVAAAQPNDAHAAAVVAAKPALEWLARSKCAWPPLVAAAVKLTGSAP